MDKEIALDQIYYLSCKYNISVQEITDYLFGCYIENSEPICQEVERMYQSSLLEF